MNISSASPHAITDEVKLLRPDVSLHLCSNGPLESGFAYNTYVKL